MGPSSLATALGSPVISGPAEWPAWPTFGEDEIAAVAEVLRSGRVNYWTGEEGRLFEREFAAWCGASHAVALMNGTVAIEGSLRALGIGPGDEVIVPPRTFLATASAVVAVGAKPVFADVDADSGNITAAAASRCVGPRTRAIIAVHLAGWPCDLGRLLQLAESIGAVLIEDCAQSHGARIGGRLVGTFGHAAAFSFCQDKILTTAGEGGMVVTNDRDLFEHVWAYKDHGKSWDAVFTRSHPPGFRWLNESFGSNWRMTELQAAQGRIALRKLDGWVARRRRHAARLTSGLSSLSALRTPAPTPDVLHSYYKFYTYVRPEALAEGWSRDRVMQEIGSRGVPCFSGSCSEVYLERAFDGHPSRPEHRLPVARELGETSLTFQVHPTLDDEHIERTLDVVTDVMRAATR